MLLIAKSSTSVITLSYRNSVNTPSPSSTKAILDDVCHFDRAVLPNLSGLLGVGHNKRRRTCS